MPQSNHIIVNRADPALVKQLTDHLIAAYNQFLAGHPDLPYTVGFMSAHNFHKVVVLDLEERIIAEKGPPPSGIPWLRHSAVDTFRIALLGEELSV